MSRYDNAKIVKVNNREFSIRKFDARTGSFMLVKVTGLLAPVFKGAKFKVDKSEGDKLPSIDISGVISVLSTLSEADFIYIQDKCLNVCFEILDSGPAKVLNENGSFGVIGLEDDTMTVMALTAHALIFNVTSFFSGSPLAGLVGEALSMIQSTVKM